MHVYHYAAYEVTALKKLTGGYGVREAELDQLLREERFVDLYPVVRQSMRISKESYSIKKVEEFYGRSHAGAVASALGSVLMYEQWLADRDAAKLDDDRVLQQGRRRLDPRAARLAGAAARRARGGARTACRARRSPWSSPTRR